MVDDTDGRSNAMGGPEVADEECPKVYKVSLFMPAI